MSFDQKIKEKLEGIRPDYTESAWKNFSKLMPVPWYISLFRDFGSLIYGGIATTALLGTTYLYFSQKTENEKLNTEISTLKNQIQDSKKDTLYINQTVYDTVIQVKVVERIIRSETKDPECNYFDETAAMDLKQVSAEKNISELLDQRNPVSNNKVSKPEGISNKKQIAENAQLNEQFLGEDTKKESGSTEKKELITVTEKQEKSDQIVNEVADQKIGENTEKGEFKINGETVLVEEITDEENRNIPAKKKLKIPDIRARVGLATDYLGLKVFANGPTAEIFLGKKISLSTSLLMSGQQVIKDPFPKDFNLRTGLRFEDQFQDHIIQRPENIENITIKTSLVKLPLNLTYYINTWSRFSFLVTMGTKLDLSVYQEVDFVSYALGQQLRSKFEAKPSPKVFNNLNYGTGLQYQYKRIVGQVVPYFDFYFRRAEYFSPPRNFGINAAVKFEFGK